MKKFTQYKANVVEEEILKFWNKQKIFKKSLEKTKNGRPFSFYDGPPFANGLPHFGHSLVQAIKDSIGRYQTMQGRYVARRNGWDCHGLPVEFAIEKDFGVSGKKQIMELGLEKFNKACRDSVFSYKTDWEGFFERIGRWADTENAYATIDTNYTESVWWVMAQIHKKGLLYKGYKSMPYCPRCSTPLSNFEVNEGYKDNTLDPSLYITFSLKNDDRKLLAWTTTPWSLGGNTAVAVNPNEIYVTVELTDETGTVEKLILAQKRLELLKQDYKVLKEEKGSELVGYEYEPIYELDESVYPQIKDQNIYKVWPASFASVEDGTGLVHVAPATGVDDLELAQNNDIPIIHVVDPTGHLLGGFGFDEVKGKFFKGADKAIIEYLSQKGRVYAAEEFAHTYPFCYRCDTPLLYYSIDTWFVSVSKIKPELLKAAESIEWTPEHIKTGRFGKWLEGARDWAVSRNRYWGAPMPVWVNVEDESDYMVIESIEELKKYTKGKPDLSDLHRPFIDDVVLERDGKTYKRVEEVIDCWFESGSMPYAQAHYPFENESKFNQTFPADYIGEGLDQTRLWFYVLHVLSTILFDKPAYKHVLVNGMVMAADGQKLSKRLRNYPPIEEVFAKEGADSLRFYLLSSQPAVSGDYMRFNRDGLKDVNRNLFMTLSNSVGFLSMYAQIDNWQPENVEKPDSLSNPLDTWLVARVEQTIAEVTVAANNFDLAKASWPVYELTQDISNWYIRRSRRRFWKSEDDSDKLEAYKSLHWALVVTCKLLAPWSPFAADYFYRHLVDGMNESESVHLTDWPIAEKANVDVVRQMGQVREIVNEGLSARAEVSIKVRQPLESVKVETEVELSDALKDIILEELNIKNIDVKKATKLKVLLNTNITRKLKNEGIAREIIRNIANARKEAKLDVDNRIKLGLGTSNSEINAAIKQCKQLIQNEVLATTFNKDNIQYEFSKVVKIEGANLEIKIKKV